jgi:hypothetical protein
MKLPPAKRWLGSAALLGLAFKEAGPGQLTSGGMINVTEILEPFARPRKDRADNTTLSLVPQWNGAILPQRVDVR